MSSWKTFLSFNRQERNGLFYLLCIILLLQLATFLIRNMGLGKKEPEFRVEVTTAANLLQLSDSSSGNTLSTYPFNPNYITDFKGYTIGLSPGQLDSLYSFREGNNFVNSASEFQQVTGITDSLLEVLTPHFLFRENFSPKRTKALNTAKKSFHVAENHKSSAVVQDLNSATAAQLRTISGIGPVLSERIIRFRSALGAFQTERQLLDVFGLEPQVAMRAMARFKVLQPPVMETININTASVEELAGNVYISFATARAIVRYREQNGAFISLDSISALEGFPSEKIDRISLYLSL